MHYRQLHIKTDIMQLMKIGKRTSLINLTDIIMVMKKKTSYRWKKGKIYINLWFIQVIDIQNCIVDRVKNKAITTKMGFWKLHREKVEWKPKRESEKKIRMGRQKTNKHKTSKTKENQDLT